MNRYDLNWLDWILITIGLLATLLGVLVVLSLVVGTVRGY